jgi:hypothetical protein
VKLYTATISGTNPGINPGINPEINPVINPVINPGINPEPESILSLNQPEDKFWDQT